MKTALAFIVVIAIGVLAYWLKPVSIPSGKILVNKTFLDSLANVKPDTVRIVTKGDPYPVNVPVYVPIPQKEDTSSVFYSDSLVDKKVNIHLWDTIQKRTGKILSRRWQYQLFVPEKVETVITKPFPVPYAVDKASKEWRYYGNVWVGQGIQGEAGFIYKDRYMLGTKAGVKSVELGIGIIFN